jgi:predicted glutamine amidotransferase
MCLILVRDPGVQLPFENVKHAVLNNPHGWGYIIPDRGKLEIRRHFDPKGTNPDDVYKVLDSNLEQRVFLHLRYCTAGDRSKLNVHPFPALSQRKDGMQVWVMHNGTVQEFKSGNKDSYSDTYHFTNKVINPLLKRVMAYTGKKAVLKDPFVAEVIERFANNWSKWTLIDNYGNFMCAGSDWVEKEGYLLSNEYSFKPSYREPVKSTAVSTYNHGYPTYNARNHNRQPDVEDAVWEDCTVPGYPFRGDTTATAHSISEAKKNDDRQSPLDNATTVLEAPKSLNLESRLTFLELLGMKSLDELGEITEDQLHELVTEYPEVICVLIQDLLLEREELKAKEVDNGGKV